MRLLNVSRLASGFSRETLQAKLEDDSFDEITVVIRNELPGGGLLDAAGLALADEIPFLRLAHGHGLPVANVLWHETDSSVLGGQFIVTSFMSGDTLGTSTSATHARSSSVMRYLAELLAGLHQVDWSAYTRELCTSSGLDVDRKVTENRET
jgi:aminoglycoside phosphotransferase (APT) family kinase protein